MTDREFGWNAPFDRPGHYYLDVTRSELSTFDATRGAGGFWASQLGGLYYGNYGGAGYYQGQFSRDGKALGVKNNEPVDLLDAIFQRHDWGYGRADGTESEEIEADRIAVAEIEALLANPNVEELIGKDGIAFARKARNFFLSKILTFQEEQPDYVEPDNSPLCFPAMTKVTLKGGATINIEKVSCGIFVRAIGENSKDDIAPCFKRVTRLFRNVTKEWIELDLGETDPDNGTNKTLTCTPGHHFLDEFGNFPTIAEMLLRGGKRRGFPAPE